MNTAVCYFHSKSCKNLDEFVQQIGQAWSTLHSVNLVSLIQLYFLLIFELDFAFILFVLKKTKIRNVEISFVLYFILMFLFQVIIFLFVFMVVVLVNGNNPDS